MLQNDLLFAAELLLHEGGVDRRVKILGNLRRIGRALAGVGGLKGFDRCIHFIAKFADVSEANAAVRAKEY